MCQENISKMARDWFDYAKEKWLLDSLPNGL